DPVGDPGHAAVVLVGLEVHRARPGAGPGLVEDERDAPRRARAAGERPRPGERDGAHGLGGHGAPAEEEREERDGPGSHGGPPEGRGHRAGTRVPAVPLETHGRSGFVPPGVSQSRTTLLWSPSTPRSASRVSTTTLASRSMRV